MLIQFNFKNYKSFRGDTSLDLSATKISEYNNQVVTIANDRLLRTAAIYGANASGKSNVHDAFRFMSIYVLDSFAFGGTGTKKKRRHLQVRPFKLDKDSQNEKSTFEVFFIDKSDGSLKSYQYGFSLKGSTVAEEWLFYKSKTGREYKTIFYRNAETDQLDFDKIPAAQAENIKASLAAETLIVSLGEKLRVTKLKMVYNWFFNNEVIDFSSDYESLFRSNMLPDKFVDDIDVQNKVVQFFSSFDESIIGFDIKKVLVEDSGGGDDDERYIINAKHKVIGSNEVALIPLQDESKGTLEMFSLFPFMQDVLNNGSLLFVDELNTKLHPLLVRNIILTFANPIININNAQLVFTTHDTWQLSNNLLRRDEIWFTDKDSNGVSSLYSLADFVDDGGVKIRKDESYEKNYLLGKYGAIPSLKTIDFLVGV
jgi:AAA15 family ATPase/GTPase